MFKYLNILKYNHVSFSILLIILVVIFPNLGIGKLFDLIFGFFLIFVIPTLYSFSFDLEKKDKIITYFFNIIYYVYLVIMIYCTLNVDISDNSAEYLVITMLIMWFLSIINNSRLFKKMDKKYNLNYRLPFALYVILFFLYIPFGMFIFQSKANKIYNIINKKGHNNAKLI